MFDDQPNAVETGYELSPKSESLESRLQYQLKNAKAEVVRIERLQVLLEKNPEIKEVIQLMKGRM